MKKDTHSPPSDSTWISRDSQLRPALNDNWQARRELATALRQLNSAALTADIPTEMLRAVTTAARAETARFEACARAFGNQEQSERVAAETGHYPDLFYEMTPAMGQSNAVAPPMHIWHADGRTYALAAPDWAYEGPIGYVHGGVISLLFDQLLGVAALTTGNVARTGTLTIRYHNPTPLNTELHLVADVDRVEGRKQFLVGEMWVGDVLTASCEGIFIAAKQPPEAAALDSQA